MAENGQHLDLVYPLQGLFAIDKPTGILSMRILDQLKPLLASSPFFRSVNQAERPAKRRRFAKGKDTSREKELGIKLGQGGTLDPLATGVLVIGVNGGTRALQTYLTGVKEYRVTGILGAATDSLDAEGKITHVAPWRHITRQDVEAKLEQFRGDIKQLPPAYSAIQIDGKRLYDYARRGTPLPRAVEQRSCTIASLELEEWHEPGTHSYAFPASTLSPDELKIHRELLKKMGKPLPDAAHPPSASSEPNGDTALPNATVDDARPGATAAFSLRMAVSGGTYVRTVIDDLATSLGTAAFVAKLERTRQGPFELGERDCVPWSVLSEAIAACEGRDEEAKRRDADRTVETEMYEWEMEIVKRCRAV